MLRSFVSPCVQSQVLSGKASQLPESICVAAKTRKTAMTIIGPNQHSTTCACCGATLISPEWSESTAGQKTVRIWHCIVCGHEFETTDDAVEPELPDTELVQEFLPNLLVA